MRVSVCVVMEPYLSLNCLDFKLCSVAVIVVAVVAVVVAVGCDVDLDGDFFMVWQFQGDVRVLRA